MSALEILLFVGAAGALVTLAMSVANLLLLKRTNPRAAVRPDVTVSVCIPARNEAANIADCVRAVLASDHPQVEVLVYDDESTDGTGDIVAALVREDARCRSVPARALPAGWVGKQHACWQLARDARGDWLLFLDADVRLRPDAMRRALDYVLRTGASLVSTFPRQVTQTWGECLLVPTMFFVLLSYLPFVLMRLTRMQSASAGCGQFLLARAADYNETGGHAAFRTTMHDGIRMPRVFRAHGFRTDLFDGTDLGFVRMYRGFGTAWRGFVKNAYEGLGSMGALIGLSIFHVIAHVLPWVLMPVMLIAGDALATAGATVAVGAAATQRLLLAHRFRHSATLALVHPFTIVLMIALQWASWRADRTGVRGWKGRVAQPAKVEQVVLVDDQDREIGTEEKLRAHAGPGRLHRAFSVFLFDRRGHTLLQRRACGKYHFGGLWTNACCGHPRPGEDVVAAAERRLREEMGIRASLETLGSFVYTARDPASGLVEHELDHVYIGYFDGAPDPDPLEAEGWRWIDADDLDAALEHDTASYTPWLPIAWALLRESQASAAARSSAAWKHSA